ncbi:MAG: hypothetical protein U5S82_01290 [Gammaproteobacteria bacterium]|nr:hypothetical protein [Gammaproteobacteria bacterium]
MDPEAEGIARAIAGLARDTITRVRSITRQLRPVTLDRLGLRDAITETVREWAARHPGVHCDLCITGVFDALDWSQNIAFFRVLQESLTNVSRHAGAERVWVSMTGRQLCHDGDAAGPFTLVVEDDGRGLPSPVRDGGLGLMTMSERMGACGGELEIARGRAGGVRVTARLGTS